MRQLKVIFIFLSIIIFNLSEGSPISFKRYYPDNCNLNNNAANVIGTCVCIQDKNTQDIWLAVSNESGMSWSGITGPTLGASAWIKALNISNICDIKDGWSLPTQDQLNTLASHTIDWFNDNGFIGIDPNGKYWGGLNNDQKTALLLSIGSGAITSEPLNYVAPNTYAFAVHSPPNRRNRYKMP